MLVDANSLDEIFKIESFDLSILNFIVDTRHNFSDLNADYLLIKTDG